MLSLMDFILGLFFVFCIILCILLKGLKIEKLIIYSFMLEGLDI